MPQNQSQIVPIVLAGGRGTRLWPISRSSRPKQFLALGGAGSLFQETLQRVADPDQFAAPIIVTNEDYRFLVAEQAQEMGIELGAILLEPAARNTTAAILAAALYAQQQNEEDQVLYVLASDHKVKADAGYHEAVKLAAECAGEGALVTFGITPTEPATGYGYIKQGEALPKGGHKVAEFVEKPQLERAQQMLDEGGFYWNSGTFMMPRDVYVAECERLAPETSAAVAEAAQRSAIDMDFVRLDKKSFEQAPDISVDYAIFEKTDRAVVVPSAFSWSDLGSWDAVWKVGDSDEGGNVTQGEVTLSDTNNSLVYSDYAHVAVHGLDNVAVVVSEDAVFVGNLNEAQRVGDIVKRLKSQQETQPLTETHKTSYRPWGGYSSLVMGDRFQVKRLFVKPGKQLSLQKHHHRSEHWVVVTGTAEVTVGDKVQLLGENQSVYIPQGEVHRLANPGKILLELIEVQTGAYFGEDDIIRLEDEFGRA
ncbi:mannose-1-phosphate guanylyltransferase/mannose-6-phosphate isomerase [Maritalea mediterranea]|uniref:mannose-1-phosphate guanylyltransferase n=1 Tax=Maritalea mediterranea TaxID=2909667 RepID=A0ABS9EAG5_9HYPH|nr:mannose-1-phosphate guanylyltransferase/mannose-6-phosphate isomerase [Maritalea mediterranea]MCF4098418.1 mannose-1-phosphate guanylyltransferase/mannose-6-phosphate isomerase [Maritalea mediterranea]